MTPFDQDTMNGLAARPIDCDQVAWMMHALMELSGDTLDGNLKATAVLEEIMETLGLTYADADAAVNALPYSGARAVVMEALESQRDPRSEFDPDEQVDAAEAHFKSRRAKAMRTASELGMMGLSVGAG